jgi:hypothetical protein
MVVHTTRLCLGLILLGCGSYTSGAPTNDAGPDVRMESLRDASPPEPERILYVASGGSDTQDGLTPKTALQTIGAAISQLDRLPNYEIHVCRGTYSELDLSVRRNATLRGGYDCVTWARGQGYGKAGSFNDANKTLILAGVGNTTRAALLVTGAAAKDVLVEGFYLVGPDAAGSASAGTLITDGAVVTLRDLESRGGGGTSTENATHGILLSSARATIDACRANGGSGVTTQGAGSLGVVFFKSSGSLKNSIVDSGTGTGPYGTRGLVISDAPSAVTIEDSNIRSSRGTRLSNTATAAYLAIEVSRSPDVTISRNLLDGLPLTCTGTGPCGTMAILASASANLHVTRNRIQVSAFSSPAPTNDTYGVYQVGNNDFVFANNVVLVNGSTSSPSTIAGASMVGSSGLVANNTLLIRDDSSLLTPAIGLSLQTVTKGIPAKLRVANNLIHLNGSGIGLQVNMCRALNEQSLLESLVSNATWSKLRVLVMRDDLQLSCTKAELPSIARPEIQLALTETGNLDLADASQVVPDSGGWTAAFENKTLGLAAKPCVIQSKGQWLPEVTDDIDGKARGMMPTIGAWEGAAICP